MSDEMDETFHCNNQFSLTSSTNGIYSTVFLPLPIFTFSSVLYKQDPIDLYAKAWSKKHAIKSEYKYKMQNLSFN